MPINLHEQAKLAIQNKLSENLKYISVKHGMLLQHVSVFLAAYEANDCLPTGKIYNQLVDYIDDLPFIEFVTELLRKELNENIDYVKDEVDAKSLIEVQGYSDPDQVSGRIVSQLDSLPWEYTISLSLPEKLLPLSVLVDGPVEFTNGRIRNVDLLARRLITRCTRGERR